MYCIWLLWFGFLFCVFVTFRSFVLCFDLLDIHEGWFLRSKHKFSSWYDKWNIVYMLCFFCRFVFVKLTLILSHYRCLGFNQIHLPIKGFYFKQTLALIQSDNIFTTNDGVLTVCVKSTCTLLFKSNGIFFCNVKKWQLNSMYRFAILRVVSRGVSVWVGKIS